MKKLFPLIALLLVPFLWGCPEKEPDNPDNPDNPDTPVVEKIETITATLDATTIKTVWEEGDAIQVYNVTEDGADIEAKYVLSAGAGSATGTFKADGAALVKGGKGFFATYPYNEDMTFAQHNTFSFTVAAEQDADAPLFAFAEDASSLKFNSVLGAVKFTLTGKGSIAAITLDDKNTESVLSGNATFNPKTNKLSVKNSGSSKYSVTKKLADKIVLEDATSAPVVIEIPAGTLATGGALTLLDVNNSPLAVVEIPAQDIKAGVVADAGNLAFKATMQTVDLSTSGLANCYIVPDVGKYKFPAVKGNDSSETLSPATVEVLWETYCNNEEVVAGSLIPKIELEDGYIVFETADPFHPGNALVCAKDAAGDILWSWHLWMPATEITSNTYGLGETPMMDRYLGALKAAVWGEPADPQTFGFFYQWGRKDPFIGVGDMESKTVATVAGVERTKPEGQMTIAETIKNPTAFANYKGDWNPEPDNALWAEVKTIYDPCPPGYKVPTAADCAIYTANDSSYADDLPGWGFDAEVSMAFKVGEPSTVFPVCGYLNYNGSYDKPGQRVKIYVAPCSGEYGPALYFYEGPVYKHSAGQRRGVAGAIRCVAISNN